MYKEFGRGIIINLAEQNLFLREIGEKYDVLKITKGSRKDEYILDIFNGQMIGYPKNLYDRLHVYDEVRNEMAVNNETLLDTFIKNSNIWIKYKCPDDSIKSTNLKGYKRISAARKKLYELAEQRGHKILSYYRDTRSYILVDYGCTHPANKVNANSYISSNVGCPICSSRKVIPNCNDAFTLAPYMHKYFENPRDLIGVRISDRTKRIFKCPLCGSPKEDTISNVYYFGFHCPTCDNKVSYPERLMANILNSLGVPYKMHVYFDWCKFPYNNYERQGIYDVVIESQKVIIEMDGGFHQMDNISGIPQQDIMYFDEMKDILAREHGYTIIRIDCAYNHKDHRLEYIKNNIILKLGNLFDLSMIDWNQMDCLAMESELLKICDLWNKGYGIKQIGEMTKMCSSSIREYLTIGKSQNICDYSTSDSRRRCMKKISLDYNVFVKATRVDTKELSAVFWDVNVFIAKYQPVLHKEMRRNRIRSVLNPDDRRNKSAYGLLFERITKEEYLHLIDTKGIITDKEEMSLLLNNGIFNWEELE